MSENGTNIEKIVAFHDEIVLEDYLRDSESGNTCVFKLPVNTEDHQFASFRKQKGKSQTGQRFSATLVPIEPEQEDGRTPVRSSIPNYYDPIDVELILLRWRSSPKTGRSVSFLIKYADGRPLHPLDKFPVYTGKQKVKNQHFITTMVELNDDETPKEQEENNILAKDPDELPTEEEKEKVPFSDWSASRQCGMLCGTLEFKEYLTETRFSIMQKSVDSADCIRQLFQIGSRRQLNEEPCFAKWKWLLNDFNAWKARKKGFI